MKRIYALCTAIIVVFASCQKLGDNSDYDFGDDFSEESAGDQSTEGGAFADGYERLPETVRLDHTMSTVVQVQILRRLIMTVLARLSLL